MKKLSVSLKESRFVDLINKKFTGEIRKEDMIGNLQRLKPVDIGTSVLWADDGLCVDDKYFFTFDEVTNMLKDSEWRLPTVSEVKELKNADLSSLFEMTEIDLTDEEFDKFGDKEYILYRLENELNCQFNTRKQLVLKTIYAYIDLSGSLYNTESLSLFGTNSFNLVWEKVCAEILDNQLEKTLSELNLPVPVQKDDPLARVKLIDLIEKPKWSVANMDAKDTLKPDLITISGEQFIIFDAKYYTPIFARGKTPKNQPGIESVTKQYLYQLAYQEFISKHGFAKDNVKNCFLMPTAKTAIQNMGTVSMKMFAGLGLKDIEVRYIPASIAYDHYLHGRKMDLKTLQLR